MRARRTRSAVSATVVASGGCRRGRRRGRCAARTSGTPEPPRPPCRGSRGAGRSHRCCRATPRRCPAAGRRPARRAAICASDRSVGMLSVSAPRSSRTAALAAFAATSITDTLNCRSGGRSPRFRSRLSTARAPRSATSTLRRPCSTARSTSSTTAASWSLAVCRRRHQRADAGAGHGRRAPAGVRAGEQAELHPGIRRDAHHVVELGVGVQEHAAPLRHPPDRHVQLVSRAHDRAHAGRTLDAGNLHPPGDAVGEALGRDRQFAEVAAGQAERVEQLRLRGRGSRSALGVGVRGRRRVAHGLNLRSTPRLGKGVSVAALEGCPGPAPDPSRRRRRVVH